MLLGYNKNCCDCPPDTALPVAVDVKFSKLPSQIPGPDLCTVTLSSCYGSGASVRIAGPIGTWGAITAVEVVDGGGGYAVLGREQPTLDIKASFGSGATFTPSLASSKGECNLPYWSIKSVSVTGGAGYIAGQSLSVAPKAGDTEAVAAKLSLRTNIPTVTATVPGGSGASLSVTLATPEGKAAGEVPYYVESVTVNNGGSGYKNGTAVTFSAPGARLASPAAATASTKLQRSAPDLTPYVWGYDGTTAGSGAVLTATMGATIDGEGKPAWEVSSVSIASGGSGYEVGEYLWYEELDPAIGSSPPYYVVAIDGWWITSVDGSGAITGLGVNPDFPFPNGLFYYGNDTGIIESVSVTDGGQYDSGVPGTVAVIEGGKYYGESDDLPAHVADVTFSISQALPSYGTGAKLAAVVGDDPLDVATFGTITGVTIEDGGENYMAAEWLSFASELYEGRVYRVHRTQCACCRFYGCDSQGNVSLAWGGQSGPQGVTLTARYGTPYLVERTLDFSSGTSGAPYACSQMSFTATRLGGGTASVTTPSGSVPTCEEILESSTLEMNISSPEYLLHYKQKWNESTWAWPNGWDYYRWYTAWFGGQDFSGDFELQKVTDAPAGSVLAGLLLTRNLWVYNFPEGSCQHKVRQRYYAGLGWGDLWITMHKTNYSMSYGALVGYSGAYRSTASGGPTTPHPPAVPDFKTQSDFVCLGPPVTDAERTDPLIRGVYLGGRSACYCNLDSLTLTRKVRDYIDLPYADGCDVGPISDAFWGPGCWKVGDSRRKDDYTGRGFRLDESSVENEIGSPDDVVTITISKP